MNEQPKKPVTQREQKVADYVVQIIFILALLVSIFIDANSKDYNLPLIVYAIMGSGAIGADNFINLLNKIRGKT